MNLKVLVAFIIYYSMMAAVFNFGGLYLTGATMTGQNPGAFVNSTNTTITTGGDNFFNQLSESVGRIGGTIGFIFFGVGLPPDTPGWFSLIFALIISGISVLAVGFVINSFWGGGGGH